MSSVTNYTLLALYIIPAYSTRFRRKNDAVSAWRIRIDRGLSLESMLTEPRWLIVLLAFRRLVGLRNDGALTTMIDCVEERLAIVRTGDTLPVEVIEARPPADTNDFEEDRRRFCSSSCVILFSLMAAANLRRFLSEHIRWIIHLANHSDPNVNLFPPSAPRADSFPRTASHLSNSNAKHQLTVGQILRLFQSSSSLSTAKRHHLVTIHYSTNTYSMHHTHILLY